MDITYTKEIKNLESLVVVEINERINAMLNSISDDNIDVLDLEILRIDREFLESIKSKENCEFGAVAPNLINKIDYILKSVGNTG